MSRNSGGVYTLPAGNPVVTGTPISSNWANNTFNDVATEMTNSLARNGFGAMLAPLKVPSGSSAVPTFTFSTDPGTGLYLNGAGELRVTASLTSIASFTASELRTFVPIAVETGGISVEADGMSVAGGVIGTGATNGAGGSFTGGATNGVGLVAQGTGTGVGVYANGGGGTSAIPTEGVSAGGVFMSNQLTANGLFAWGTSSGAGVYGKGGSTGVGGKFAAGTAATGAAPTNAVELVNGNLKLSGTAPNSSVALSNTVTPANICKAWASIKLNNTTSPVLSEAFNVTSCTVNGSGNLVVTLATAFANANYAVAITTDSTAQEVRLSSRATTTTTFAARRPAYTATDGSLNVDMGSMSDNVTIVWYGRQ